MGSRYVFVCPKCNRYGMAWDGRAKVLLCYYGSCNHVIRNVERAGGIPTEQEIERAIKNGGTSDQ